MFQCRMCSESPFSQMFGEEGKGGRQRKEKNGEKKKKPQKPAKAASRRDETAFNPRSPQELAEVIGTWQQYVHPRARDYFTDDAALEDVLMQVAKGIDRNCDPVLGSADNCVFWFGHVTSDDLQAAIQLVKPNESELSTTFVNRVLAFIFAADEDFERLMRLVSDPFKMSCGDQLCIHIAHIESPD